MSILFILTVAAKNNLAKHKKVLINLNREFANEK